MRHRDIKNGLFGWFEKGAMEKIHTLPFKQQVSVIAIYIALCSLSAKQKNAPIIEGYRQDISRYAGVTEKTLYRRLPALEELGIVKIEPQDRKSDGKYRKVRIWLTNNNLAAGHIEDRSPPPSVRYIKERKKEILMSVEDFKIFYTNYPKKKNPAKARTSFLKLDKNLLPQILAAVESQKKSPDWIKDGGKYIPYPATWINGECWENEVTVDPTKRRPGESLQAWQERLLNS